MRTTRRSLGCCTSRCTSTTMVFSIFALVTLPVRMVRSPRSATGALCVSVVITPSLLSVLARERVFSPAPDLFSLHGSSQYAAAWLKPSCAGDEFRGNRQLVRCQPHGFLGCRFVHSRHLKHDASRLHHRHPLLRRAFALAHARFGRLLGKRLVRENPDP